MAHLSSGLSSTSHFDSGTHFRQLVRDYLAGSPQLAREELELQGIRPTHEQVTLAARQALPQYINHIARFLHEAHPSVPQTVQDEAYLDALTTLLIDQRLELAALLLNSAQLPISRRVRDEIKPLAEFEIISAIKSNQLSGTMELGTTLDAFFFHRDKYCEALARTIVSHIERDDIGKLVNLVDTGVQIPDKVIFRTRSDVEAGILRYVAAGGSLSDGYALSEMFMLSDFFKASPFLAIVEHRIEAALKRRDLAGACLTADECVDFKTIRRHLQAVARDGVKTALAEFRYYTSEERSRENFALLENLNLSIREAVRIFGLPKEMLRDLPPLKEDRRLLRVGYPPCRLVHPPRREERE